MVASELELARPFTQTDWYGLAGCIRFPNGDEPVIRYVGNWAIIADGAQGGFYRYDEDSDNFDVEFWFLDMAMRTGAAAAVIINAFDLSVGDPSVYGAKRV